MAGWNCADAHPQDSGFGIYPNMDIRKNNTNDLAAGFQELFDTIVIEVLKNFQYFMDFNHDIME